MELDRKWCKGCGICVAFCPKKVFDQGEDMRPIVSKPDECIGCKLCELRCPDYALYVTEEDENG
ncbi:MAG TPA: 4Fe-4S binding protein [Firmicutes bacterium]|nr:4Fe-4S binding protein [Bacillota bacterium]